MLDLFDNSGVWVPLAVFTASLLGSSHCLAMCGGLVSAVTRTRVQWTEYQLGRLIGYLLLGGLAGWIGGRFLIGTDASAAMNPFSQLAGVMLAAALLFIGFRVWRNRPLHFSIVPKWALERLFRLSRGSVFVSGLLSAMLPCGWLHIYVVGAVATQDAYEGALFLMAFWLGTLPALSLAPWALHKFLHPLGRRSSKLAACLLMFAGVVTLASKFSPAVLFQVGKSPVSVCR